MFVLLGLACFTECNGLQLCSGCSGCQCVLLLKGESCSIPRTGRVFFIRSSAEGHTVSLLRIQLLQTWCAKTSESPLPILWVRTRTQSCWVTRGLHLQVSEESPHTRPDCSPQRQCHLTPPPVAAHEVPVSSQPHLL